MRRLVVLTLAAASAAIAVATAAPASATCMEHFDRFGVTIYSCAAPGGEPSVTYCVRETCVTP